MKRKPTAKGIRVGQTLFYLVGPYRTGKFSVGSVMVASDAKQRPSFYLTTHEYPRRFLAVSIAESYGVYSYSRRKVERAARERNKAISRRAAMADAYLESLAAAMVVACKAAAGRALDVCS